MEPPPREIGSDSSRLEKLRRALLLEVGRCCKEFGLVQHRDRVMVALSGGKDSMTLLHILRLMQRRTPFTFEIVAVTVDQGLPGFESDVIESFVKGEGVPFHLERQDTHSVVVEKVPEGKTYCSLCSRLRRGILYRVARELGATKIALGHHRDDLIETLLLNILYSGQTKAMPPRLLSDDGEHVVIRPLAYVSESDIVEFARLMSFPTSTCDLCCNQEDLYRTKVKRLLDDLCRDNPKVRGNLLASLSNVVPTHLLDRDLMARIGLPVPSIESGRTRRSYEMEVAPGTEKREIG